MELLASYQRRLHHDARWSGLRRERGAALVELAVVLPLLLVLLFGIVEAGWAFSQRLEIQHGAREAAHLTAVNYGSDADVATEVCGRMNFTGDSATTEVTISLLGGDDVGDPARVTIQATYSSLTGLFDAVFSGATISSDIAIRLEQEPRDTLGTGTVHTCAT